MVVTVRIVSRESSSDPAIHAPDALGRQKPDCAFRESNQSRRLSCLLQEGACDGWSLEAGSVCEH